MKSAYCTHCGTPIKDDAEFCTKCGARAGTPAPASASVPPLPAARVKKIMSPRTKALYGAFVAVVFAVFLYLFVDHLPGGAHPVIQNQPSIAMATMYMGQVIQPFPITATVDGDQIIFPLSVLQEHKLIEFEYRMENNVIPLLAYIAADGKLVTSIRMCEPCNSDHFRIEGMELCCSKCESRWKLNNLEGIQGNCQKYPPDPLPSIVRADPRSGAEVVAIQLSAVKNWKMRI